MHHSDASLLLLQLTLDIIRFGLPRLLCQITEGFAEIVKVRFQIQEDQLSPENYKLLCSFL